ncbi:helix-turn-helix domain-containing protein [Clavibacter californiensis]|uniref:DNA-binding protein n=1 Tax=Clavibacter californiensis TaxID=1401995 RepID=A0ABX9NAV8_9MICO|nr:helix-turn-helix domain-containing protein [Clavibacter californiensis]RII94557.1 DNA-binding protein [Clavibacter californiensis]UKF78895.1 helix-turn-helix domain-containing protein [Clavibacter californiensis]
MQERPPGSYVHGQGGPIVVLPGRVAAYLERYAGLDDFRKRIRGHDAEVYAVLYDLHRAALVWRESATGTPHEVRPEPAAEWFTTAEAAARVGITDRGIRRAIAEKRLAARLVGRSWRISRTDLAHFRASRAH